MSILLTIITALVLFLLPFAAGFTLGRRKTRRERAERVAKAWVDELVAFPEEDAP